MQTYICIGGRNRSLRSRNCIIISARSYTLASKAERLIVNIVENGEGNGDENDPRFNNAHTILDNERGRNGGVKITGKKGSPKEPSETCARSECTRTKGEEAREW